MNTPANTPQPCITQTAAQALATYINATIRPDWHPRGLTTGIGHAATTSTDPTAVAIAAIQAAANPANRTPAVIQYPGPHWPTTATTPNQPGPRTPCEDHDWENATHCRACISDIKLGQRPADRLGKHHDVTHRDDSEAQPTASGTEPGRAAPNASTLGDDWGAMPQGPENGTQSLPATPTEGATPTDDDENH